MSTALLTARRTKTMKMIENAESVLLKLSLNPRESYTINNGQTVETVTAAKMTQIQNMIDRWYAIIADIDRQLDGTGDPTYFRVSF